MNDQDVLIKILTAFEGGGIEAAKKAAGELKKEVDANSDAGKALSGALDLLNGKGQNAGDVFKGLTGILKGGQSAASGFSSVVKGLGSALGIAAGPLALLTTGIGLAVSAWQSYKSAQEEAAKAAQEAAERAKEAAEEAAKALEKRLADAADAARDKVKDLADGFTDAAKEAHELDDAMSALGDAQLALDLAKLDEALESAETPGQRAALRRKKAELKRDNEEAKRQRKRQGYQDELEALEQGEASVASTTDEAKEKFEETQRELQDAQQAAQEAEKAEARARQAAEEANAVFAKLMNNPGLAGQRDPNHYGIAYPTIDEAAARKRETEAALANLQGDAGWKRGVAQLLEEPAATAKATYDAAAQAQADLLQENLPKKDLLRTKISTLDLQTQTGDLALDASIREIMAKQSEEEKKARQQAEEEAAKNRRQPTSRDYYGAAWNAIGRGQRDKQGQLYDIDGGATQKAAREAMAEVARAMAEGKAADDEAAKAGLKQRLDDMGAVYDEGRLFGGLQKAVDLRRHPSKGKGGGDDDGSRILAIPDDTGSTLGGLSRSIAANIQDGRMVEGSPFARLDGGQTRGEALSYVKDSVDAAAQAVGQANGGPDASEIADAARGIVAGIQSMGANVQSFAKLFTDVNAAITLQAQKIATLEEQVKNGR